MYRLVLYFIKLWTISNDNVSAESCNRFWLLPLKRFYSNVALKFMFDDNVIFMHGQGSSSTGSWPKNVIYVF